MHSITHRPTPANNFLPQGIKMPGGRKVLFRRKRGGKWKKVRRHNKRKGGVKVLSSLQPFPSRQIVKMKYSDVFTTNSTNGWNYNFNLNSIFDPNRTGTGHQPYGHDQLAVLYNRYRVISCSYVLTAYSGAIPIRYACIPSNEVKLYTSVGELAENPRARFGMQIPNGSTTKLVGKVHIPSLTGRTKAQYMADDRYQAAFGSNPGELAILTCTALGLQENTTDVNWTVTLEYTVEVFDPNPIAQS